MGTRRTGVLARAPFRRCGESASVGRCGPLCPCSPAMPVWVARCPGGGRA